MLTSGQDIFLMPVRYLGGDVKLVVVCTIVCKGRALDWRYSEDSWYLMPEEWKRMSRDKYEER